MKRATKQPNKHVTAEAEKAPRPKPSDTHAGSDERRGWDGRIVIKEDIFGNKWVTT